MKVLGLSKLLNIVAKNKFNLVREVTTPPFKYLNKFYGGVKMSKNKWFDEAFLPSLFEYALKTVGLCKNCKISDKQFNICRQNMDEVNCFDSDYRVNYSYYSYKWNDRNVIVTRHNNNYISFSFNSAETVQARQEEEQTRKAEKLAILEHIKQNPERLEKSLANKFSKLEKLKKELSEALDHEEDDDIISMIKDDISKLQKDIDFLMH